MKKVSVLLSIYKPNVDFLMKQLISLDNQTYDNMEILIYDDCPTNKCNTDIFKNYIKNKKYILLPYGKKNLGYSMAFAKLVNNVNHNGYIAFCDQDDIWIENKIECMVKALENNKKKVAFCDRIIIDENDNITKDYEINDLVKDFKDDYNKLLIGSPFRTLAQGMSIICDASFAKACSKNFKDFAFDKWICCCALAENCHLHVKECLVKYRRHSSNVSGTLNKIKSKKDYYRDRILQHHKVVLKLNKRYPNLDLKNQMDYSLARVNKNVFKLFKYRWISKKNTIFEILMVITPDFVFKMLLKRI